MISAIDRVQSHLDGLSLEAFELDIDKRWLVERGIEILSEASRHLPADLKLRYPTIPWHNVANIGNIIRHAYDRVSPDVIWRLARSELDDLRTACEIELPKAIQLEEDFE